LKQNQYLNELNGESLGLGELFALEGVLKFGGDLVGVTLDISFDFCCCGDNILVVLNPILLY
jgi:hypothetical protein